MKIIIKTLFLFTFLFTSCIGENRDDCSARRNFVFTHYCLYDENTNFDDRIANDVMLYIFQNKKLKAKELIPYEQIKNKKTYSRLKEYGEEVDLVVWAVPEGSFIVNPDLITGIPDFDYEEDFNSEIIQNLIRSVDCRPFSTDLYLGTEEIVNDRINKESTHHIRMINCACLVSVTVNDPRGLINDPGQEKTILVEGIMNQINLHYQGTGEEAEIRAGLTENTPHSFTAPLFGVLPSADSQQLKFTVYEGATPRAVLTTDYKAVSGERIEITIEMGVRVDITVNGSDWDMYVDIQWM